MAACAHPIAGGLREKVDSDLSFARLFQSPADHDGKRVLLGGIIVQTRNLPETSEIEVVQKELDSAGYPESGDATGGRFIFVAKGFLDAEI